MVTATHRRGALKTLDLQSKIFIQGIAGGAAHHVKLLPTQPIPRGVKQSPRRINVIDTFDKTKEPNLIMMNSRMQVVSYRCNSADDRTANPRDKKLGFAVAEKGVPSAIKPPPFITDQRRNPIRVAPVDLPGQVQEIVTVSARSDR